MATKATLSLWRRYFRRNRMRLQRGALVAGLLWTIICLLVALWIVGLVVHVGGGLIHLLIVVALVLFVFNLISGRGARV